jgi:hypothetical protein
LATPFLSFHAPDIAEGEIQAAVETLRFGWLAAGARARQFEEDFAWMVTWSSPFMLQSVIEWLSEQGASAPMGYFLRGSAPWRQARAAGFLRLTRPLTPRHYPVCASVRPGEPHTAKLLNPSHWYMSFADSDLA